MENQYNYYHSDEPSAENNYNSQPNFNNTAPHRPKNKIPKVVAVTGFALLFGVVSSATFLTSNIVGNKVLGLSNTTDTVSKTTTIDGNTLTKTSNVVTSDVSEVVDGVMPSIVSITNMSVQQVQDFFGGVSQQESESAGTGIIISQNDTELLMVTNNHVVEGSETLTVTFNDNTSLEADVKGTDPTHDLAVIAVQMKNISSETMDAIAVATLGDSSKLKVGEPAIAIGNALGYGQSVTTGVISATDRESTTEDMLTGEQTTSDVKLIQTDAAINPGNSGGALVNASGEVIGINSSKLVGGYIEGVGYAIPVSEVSDIITDLMNQKTKAKVSEADRGYLGIEGIDVTTENAERFDMPLGVYITNVTDGGGAKAAGLTKGTVITEIEGSAVDSMETLKEQLKYYASGDTVKLKVMVPGNGGAYDEQTVQVKLADKAE